MASTQLKCYELKGKTLWLFGCEHIHTISDQTFTLLDKRVHQFAQQYGNKVILAAEGVVPDERLSLPRMIKKYREMGYLSFVSQQLSCSVRSIETTEAKIISQTIAAKKYPDEDVFVWLVLNSIDWSPRTRTIRSVRAIRTSIDQRLKYGGPHSRSWRSLADQQLMHQVDMRIKARLRRGILTKVGNIDRAWVHHISDPFGRGYYARVGRLVNLQRELLLAANIHKILGHNHCFVVVGHNHVGVIDQVLRQRGVGLRSFRS